MTTDREKLLARNIGIAIATRRKALGMTQEDMAIKLDCGVEAVSRLERGTVLSTIPRLIEIAEVLGVPFNELIGVSSDIPSDQALHITRMLEKLNPSDRLLVLGFVEQLVKRLSS